MSTGRFWSYATDISVDGQTVLFNSPADNIAPEGDDRPRPLFPDDYSDTFVPPSAPSATRTERM